MIQTVFLLERGMTDRAVVEVSEVRTVVWLGGRTAWISHVVLRLHAERQLSTADVSVLMRMFDAMGTADKIGVELERETA